MRARIPEAVVGKLSAGLLLYRQTQHGLEVFLVHPGGPFWAKKDDGAWSIPKGEYEPDEDPLAAARREFEEETGFTVSGTFAPLSSLRQSSGKTVTAWAVEGDCDAAAIESNTFLLEWPPRSGKYQAVPEVDRAQWFDLDTAKRKILKGQVGFLLELEGLLAGG
jgi:predicted NUDIX family NTP pyrophosphohydrolase